MKYQWFVDCFASLAMTKKGTVIARVAFAISGNLVMGHWDNQTKLVIARVARNSWQSCLFLACHCENLPHTLSLREFVELVAISVWRTLRPIKRLSLREPKVRGNPLIY